MVPVGFGVAEEADFDRLRRGDLPGIAELQPFVGFFDLPTVYDLLAKDAELVAQTVADHGHSERGERVEKACGQPAQAAVAEARLRLFVGDWLEIEPEGAECLFGLGGQAEVQEIVFEMRPEQVLRAKEGEDSNVLLTVTFDGFKPLVHEPVAYDGG